MVVPRNFSFYECKYKIKYMKWENNSYLYGEVKGEEGDKFTTFDSSSGNASFVSLIFDVKDNFDYINGCKTSLNSCNCCSII